MIGGVLFLTLLGNVAAAQANSAARTLLSQATSQIRNMVLSMSQGCSGGPHGVPPVNWEQLKLHADSAVNELTSAQSVLSQDQNLSQYQKENVLKQINIAQGELDALLNGVHGNCSGGAHGIDPVGMSGYLATKAVVQGRLDDVRISLGG
jgi:hypothetical protein